MAYTPDVARENMLRNLVKQLEPLNQDLLLVTHSIPPTDIIKQFDYVLYDKENIMVPMYETENFSLYSNEFFYVQTQLNAFNLQNHGVAALKMLYLGLSTAKTLGYKTVMQIEFDTELLNTDCLKEWHKLLETFDTVVFGANHGFYDLQCNFFNLGSFSYQELQYNE